MREYRVEFDDDTVLTFSASTQPDALGIVVFHADPDQEFTLKSRKEACPATSWDDIKRSSYWKVAYPGSSCRRVR